MGTLRHVSWNWELGITTAPRARPTLEQTIASLADAGWRQPRLFVEPGTQLPPAARQLRCTRRGERLGALPNFCTALTELFFCNPHADAYLMLQDDVVLARGLRAYLERQLWPADNVGVVSLFCPSHWSDQPPGFRQPDPGWQAWGAQAFLFSHASLQQFLRHPLVWEFRQYDRNGGRHNVDSVVGQWCRMAGLAYFVHVPSLVQHVGHTSTLYPSAALSGKRLAADFVADATTGCAGSHMLDERVSHTG